MSHRSRRRTRLWLAFYTAVLLAIGGASIATGQWSIAFTTLALAIVFAWFTRRMWRGR